MIHLRCPVVVLAVSSAGWMLFDGSRALIMGDYVTPRSGGAQGQLGPWAQLVAAVGIQPRSTLMKTIFVIYGAIWLAVTAAYVLGAGWAWWAMVLAAACSLWYLPVGTALGLLQLFLLFLCR